MSILKKITNKSLIAKWLEGKIQNPNIYQNGFWNEIVFVPKRTEAKLIKDFTIGVNSSNEDLNKFDHSLEWLKNKIEARNFISINNELYISLPWQDIAMDDDEDYPLYEGDKDELDIYYHIYF